jgi:hypothetical protein
MTDEPRSPRAPRPPDLRRRTLTPFGYAVCVAVPMLIAAVGLTFLHFNYDKEDLVDGTPVPILTSDWEPGDAGHDAFFGGQITYGDDGCVRVGGEVVVWPHGYEATVQHVGSSDQLKIYDPDRHIVGRSGQTIETGGGYADAAPYAGGTCAPDSGEVFLVQSEITVVGAE